MAFGLCEFVDYAQYNTLKGKRNNKKHNVGSLTIKIKVQSNFHITSIFSSTNKLTFFVWKSVWDLFLMYHRKMSVVGSGEGKMDTVERR